jgi:beta-glucosidase
MRISWVIVCAGALAAGFLLSAPPAAVKFSSFDAQANKIVSRMTLDEKVGQMTQVDHNDLGDPDDVSKYFLGSVLNGGDSDPRSGNRLEDWTAMYQGYQAHALETRLKIPLLYGVDAVHGHNNVLGAVIFPHNIGLGCTRNPALVERAERAVAEEVRATGINWAFAPCVAAPQDERWGRTYEGYSESPEVVKPLAAAAVRGLEGDNLRSPFSVLACAKHFIGDGGTTWGTGQASQIDQGDTRVDEATLRSIHLQGYVSAIEAGAGSIMPSYNSWNGQKVSGSHRLLTEILKGELGFDGFLISDWAALDQLPGDYSSQVAQTFNAGMDMAMVPKDHARFIKTLKGVIADGRVPMSRVDDAVRRILRVKFAMGLMDSRWSSDIDRKAKAAFGGAEHRAVARECVRESMVLLKNNRNTLPLAKQTTRIHVAGKNADDLGNQCGGWTITWQGKSGAPTTGTTILAGIKAAVAKTTNITYSRDGSDAAGADVGVVVMGETPYAEMKGDRPDLSLAREDVEAVDRMKGAGIPVVLVVVSGRPLILGDTLTKADAVIAAWLPGTEGGGVADVLFGDYKPTGKLSLTWPRTMAQIGVHPGDAKYDPQFAYGFGLSY